jgi:hypothetical protein
MKSKKKKSVRTTKTNIRTIRVRLIGTAPLLQGKYWANVVLS